MPADRRQRRSLLLTAAAAVAIGVVVAVIVDHRPAGGPAVTTTTGSTATGSTTTGSTTTEAWTAPADDPTQPSPRAIAVDREQWAVPADVDDCGVVVLTSGWPTTTAVRPDTVDCILGAAADGRPAQYTVTGRTDDNGMAGTTFRVDGPDRVIVRTYRIDVEGILAETTEECMALVAGGNPAVPVCV